MTPSCPLCCTRLIKPADLRIGETVLCPACDGVIIWVKAADAPFEHDRLHNHALNFYQVPGGHYHNETKGLRTMTRYQRGAA